MEKKLLLFILFLVITISSFSWDRYSNESEIDLSTVYEFDKIIKYYFTVSSPSSYEFKIDDIRGENAYPVFYLWNYTTNTQETKIVNENATKTKTINLKAGNYVAFIKSYDNASKGTCDFYINNVKKRENSNFGGKILFTNGFEGETLIKTKDITGKSFIMLFENTGLEYNLIGFNYYNSDGVEAAQNPNQIAIGCINESESGTCTLSYTKDKNLEFITLCGEESRHAESGNAFIDSFDFDHYKNYDNPVAADNFHFLGSRNIDKADFLWIHSHGGIGGIYNNNGNWVDFTCVDGSVGSGNRTYNKSGDLEYAAFLSCKTVRIESETNLSWLDTRGWRTHIDSSGNIVKGFFDGMHVVVGYHTNHNVHYDYIGIQDSYIIIANTFAHRLEEGYTIWNAWKKAKQKAEDEHDYPWYYFKSSLDCGTASTIFIECDKEDTLDDFRDGDIVYGNSNYILGYEKYE